MAGRAALWIGIYLALVTAPLAALLLGPMPPHQGFWWDFSMALGFAGLAMMGIQFVLTARFRRAAAPFGMDILYLFHRYLAIAALFIVLGHFGILWWRHEEALGELDPRVARWELTSGRLALVCFALAVVTSQWRKTLRLEYGLWRYLHVALACLGFAAAVAHILGVGNYTATPLKRALWLTATLGWLLLLVWVRLIKPWRQLGQPWRIAEVRPEAGETWTLALEPVGHAGLPRFRAGQFAWLTIGRSPFGLREHPFSIASAPEALPRLEFGIRELGDFTGRIGKLEPGEVAYLDAPYGVFSIDRHPEAPGMVGVAGGIGITPLLAMLRSLAARGDRRPIWLFYANSTEADAAFREELESLRARLALTLVLVYEEPPHEDWEGETGFVTREVLERHLPATAAERAPMHYFLCGPAAMTTAATEALEQLGVPDDHIHSEVFELV